MDSRRAESFSDGVFAVAITILVFNLLPIADKTADSLTVAGRPGHPGLAHYWPSYFAYVVSFLTIGIMWVNHHNLLAQVTKVDRRVLILNLFLLMGIVAIPFPTALVADHLTGSDGGGGQATVAAVTYGLVMIAISIGYGAMWLYLASHQERLGARRRVPVPRQSTVRFTGGNLGYVAGTLIALVSPVTALIIFGLLAIYYMFEHLPDPSGDSDATTG
ncbi:MAG TPA: TMEM175 family protein [Streptosporangiaceae bacterium]|nr:TMEM175 family protein [Streptosporangiaceae bacterium]